MQASALLLKADLRHKVVDHVGLLAQGVAIERDVSARHDAQLLGLQLGHELVVGLVEPALEQGQVLAECGIGGHRADALQAGVFGRCPHVRRPMVARCTRRASVVSIASHSEESLPVIAAPDKE